MPNSPRISAVLYSKLPNRRFRGNGSTAAGAGKVGRQPGEGATGEGGVGEDEVGAGQAAGTDEGHYQVSGGGNCQCKKIIQLILLLNV